MKHLCVYCGQREATSRDHVPPKVCFPPPRPQLITVPSCEQCNNQFSKEDDAFASQLSLRVGKDSPATERLHEKNKRILAKNHRLLRSIRAKTERAWIQNGSVIAGEGYAFHWDGENHDRMVERIIRGLYFHVFKNALSASTVVHGSWSKPFNQKCLLETWKSFHGENIGEEGQFRYRYAYVSDQPEVSIWMMIFYDRHFATGHTGKLDDDLQIEAA